MKPVVLLLFCIFAYLGQSQRANFHENGDCGAIFNEDNCRVSQHEGDRCYWKFQQHECIAGGNFHDCDHICEGIGSVSDCESGPEGCNCVYDHGEGKCITYSTLLREAHQSDAVEGLQQGNPAGMQDMEKFFCETKFKNDLAGCSAHSNCCPSAGSCIAQFSGVCDSEVVPKKPKGPVKCEDIKSGAKCYNTAGCCVDSEDHSECVHQSEAEGKCYEPSPLVGCDMRAATYLTRNECYGKVSAVGPNVCRWDYKNNSCKEIDPSDQEGWCPTVEKEDCNTEALFCCWSMSDAACVKPDMEDCSSSYQLPLNTVWDCEYQSPTETDCLGKNDVERSVCKISGLDELPPKPKCTNGVKMAAPTSPPVLVDEEGEAIEHEGETEHEAGEIEHEAEEIEHEAEEIEHPEVETEAGDGPGGEAHEEAQEAHEEAHEAAQEAAEEANGVGVLTKRHTAANCESEDLFDQAPCEAAGCSWDLAQNICYPTLFLKRNKDRCSSLSKGNCFSGNGHICIWNSEFSSCHYVGAISKLQQPRLKQPASPNTSNPNSLHLDIPLWALLFAAGATLAVAFACLISKCSRKSSSEHPFLPNENSQYDLVLEETNIIVS